MFDEYRTSLDMAGRLRLWCAAHGYPVGDGAVIEHDRCLTEPVTIVLATTTGMPRKALALVSINDGSPEAYADRTTDDSSRHAAPPSPSAAPAATRGLGTVAATCAPPTASRHTSPDSSVSTGP